MNCPRCGSKVTVYGLPAGIYGPSFKCYSCDPYGACFTSRTEEGYEACERAKAASTANAQAERIKS